MRKLAVLTFVTLDGIMQAPGGKGEDPAGGFNLEGWVVPFFDETLGAEMGRQMSEPFDLLLGRQTYDIFTTYWPHQSPDEGINKARKYVVTSQPVSTDWKETIPLTGEVAETVARIKSEDGPMLQVHGSSRLIQAMLAHDLVDELWLKIFPVTLGSGKRLFGAGTIPAGFRLTRSMVTPGGVIVADYARAGEVETGTIE